MKIKIYYFGSMDRSARVRWLLEELSLSYEEQQLDYMKKEHKSDEYLKINPMGAVPAVDIDGKVLIESGAICTYIADLFLDKKMAPALDDPERGIYMQWMFFAPGSIEPLMADAFRASQDPENKEKILAGVLEKATPALDTLSGVLSNKDYVVGNSFSAADIMLGTTLNWARQFGLLAGKDALLAYVKRLEERPALQKSKAFMSIIPE